jgi:hypothetical protein
MAMIEEDDKLLRRKTPPYWWPDANVAMQFFLAWFICAIVAFIIYQLLSGEALKIDPSVRDLVVFIFGIVFGNFKDVFGFTFGSSAGQKKQGELITESLKDKDKIIASNVATAASLAAGAGPTADALKAAAAVAPAAAVAAAPAAAEVAAPPAAEDAAPAAAEKAVADALAAEKAKEEGKG